MVFLQHIGITCQNIKVSSKFYRELFGLKKLWEKTVPASEMKAIFNISSPAQIIALKTDNGMLELFNFTKRKRERSGRGNITHFAITVAEKEGFIKKAKRKGVEVTLIDRENGHRTYFIKDPDGILVEIRD